MDDDVIRLVRLGIKLGLDPFGAIRHLLLAILPSDIHPAAEASQAAVLKNSVVRHERHPAAVVDGEGAISVPCIVWSAVEIFESDFICPPLEAPTRSSVIRLELESASWNLTTAMS
jgi:hypothetical protein